MGNWNGYNIDEFYYDEKKAVVVKPNIKPNGRWLYKTEYFGAFPEFEIAMLNKGYHVCYVATKTRWANDEDISEIVFLLSLARAEEAYLGLINTGWQPQQARNVLPLATKCEMIMTGFASDWKHFCSLRCPSSAHPQARELAIPLMEEFKNKGYVI